MSKRKTYKIPDGQLNMFNFDTPNMPILDKSRCTVKSLNYETAARMVETYHYAKRIPSIVLSYGLYVDDILAGTIIYSVVMNNIAASICGENYINNTLELSRLFVHDWAGSNSESWFISQSFNLLPKNIFIILSYSDISQNHIGIVYQSTNWLYTGISKESNGREYLMPDGRVLSRKSSNFSKDNNIGRNLMTWQEIQEKYPGVKKIKSSAKHRYVYFLGSKSQKKTLRKALKWQVLPYPKKEK